MMSVRELIHARKINISARPEFYSGRGATLTDLNSDILEKLYAAIKVEYGVQPAAAFVKMVADIKPLSATAFLNRLYALEGSGWQFKTRLQCDSDIDLGPDNEGRMSIALATIGNLLGGRLNDETEAIRRPFLMKHQEEFDVKKYLEQNRPVQNTFGHYD